MQQSVFWEFDSINMQKLWGHFLLFCTPTWPSHHVDANQESVVECKKQLHIQFTSQLKIYALFHN